MAVAIDDILEISYRGIGPGEQSVNNVLNVKVTDLGVAAPTAEQVASFYEAVWLTNVAPLLNSGYRLYEVTAKVITGAILGAGGWYRWIYGEQGLFPTSITGGVNADSLPNYVTASARKVTGDSRKYFRGGLRLGILSESDTNPEGNYLTAAKRAALQTGVDTLKTVTAFGGSQYVLGVLSKRLFTLGTGPALTLLQCFRPVVTLVVSEFVGSMVDRKRRMSPR